MRKSGEKHALQAGDLILHLRRIQFGVRLRSIGDEFVESVTESHELHVGHGSEILSLPLRSVRADGVEVSLAAVICSSELLNGLCLAVSEFPLNRRRQVLNAMLFH